MRSQLSVYSRERLAFAGLSFLWLACVACQVPRVDQIDARVNEQTDTVKSLEAKIKELEKKVVAYGELFEELSQRTKQDRADMQVSLDDLRVDQQTLHGDNNDIRHQIEVARTDIGKMQVDIQKLQNGGTLTPDDSDTTQYERILRVILDEKDYRKAIDDFGDFIKHYPQSPFADNAVYWRGEGYFALENYKNAILEYQRLLDNYPKSEKVCGSLLKIALCFEQLAAADKSKLFFEEVVQRCADKDEATLAKKKLEALKPLDEPTSPPTATATATPSTKKPATPKKQNKKP